MDSSLTNCTVENIMGEGRDTLIQVYFTAVQGSFKITCTFNSPEKSTTKKITFIVTKNGMTYTIS